MWLISGLCGWGLLCSVTQVWVLTVWFLRAGHVWVWFVVYLARLFLVLGFPELSVVFSFVV